MTELKTVGGVTLAVLSGDLDHHTARIMRSEIDREISERRPTRLIIDFSSVTFMDSSGIGLIMGRYKLMSEQGGEIIVARPPAYIRKVLRLAGVDRLAPIVNAIEGFMPEEKTEEIFAEKEENKIEQTTPQTN